MLLGRNYLGVESVDKKIMRSTTAISQSWQSQPLQSDIYWRQNMHQKGKLIWAPGLRTKNTVNVSAALHRRVYIVFCILNMNLVSNYEPCFVSDTWIRYSSVHLARVTLVMALLKREPKPLILLSVDSFLYKKEKIFRASKYSKGSWLCI